MEIGYRRFIDTNWCNDRTLAHIEKVHAVAMGNPPLHIWQRTQASPKRSEDESRDEAGKEAGKEAGHQEVETEAILDACGRLADPESG